VPAAPSTSCSPVLCRSDAGGCSPLFRTVSNSNIPLNSPHGSGVNAVFADGSVRFLRDSLDLNVLALLATRDDGLVASD